MKKINPRHIRTHIQSLVATGAKLVLAFVLINSLFHNHALAEKAKVASATPKNIYVLSIGIDNYPEPWNLEFSAADAKYFLSQMEDQKSKFRSIHSKLLVNEIATRENILTSLDWVASKVGTNDVGVIYISGQADVIDSEFGFIPSGESALPRRGEVKNDAQYQTWKNKNAKSIWITSKDIVKSFNAIRGVSIIVADTNYSSLLLRNYRKSAIPTKTNKIIFSGTSGKDLAEEDRGIGGGIFTRNLLKYLNEKNLSIDSINEDSSQNIIRQVFEQTEKRQRPLMLSNDKLFSLNGLNAEKELNDLDFTTKSIKQECHDKTCASANASPSDSQLKNAIAVDSNRELEKNIETKDGQCKIFIPVKIIADSYNGEEGGCAGRNTHIQAAIVNPPMKWSGRCGQDGYATGGSGTLDAAYKVILYRNVTYHGTVTIEGSVDSGHFRGEFYFNIFDRNKDHIFGGCPSTSKKTIVYDGSEFENKQAFDEFVNPELKKARLALEKKNKDEAEQRQRAYEEEQRKREKEFVSLLNSKDPQAMYLAAGKYARDGNSDKAKQIYEAITNRFPSSPFAIKASDQLTAMDRASRTESATRDADSNARQRAYNACKIEVNSCYSRTYSKGNCYRDCDSLR